MFEDLFRCAATIEKHRTAPLVEERVEYLRYFNTVGVQPARLATLAAYLLRLIRLLTLTEPRAVSVAEVEEAASQWWRPGMDEFRKRGGHHIRMEFAANSLRWLKFLGWLEEPEMPPGRPPTPQVAAFAAWARGERGYAEATVESCCAVVEDFFRFLAESNIPFASVSIVDVDRAVAAKSAHAELSRRTIENMTARLKMFFRFAEDRGWCKPGIAAAITFPRIWVNDDVPSGLKREDVVRLLATTEGDRAVDKRDRAILMLLAAYGLRSNELCRLQLDDFDWERETLRIRRPKPGRTHIYPLSAGVGQAVLRYLREVRPRHRDRTLFLTLGVPFKPLARNTLGYIVRRRLRSLGIVTGRRGPHALRHAAAQHLLDQGMAMKVIGDFLGHRSSSSTAVYAKVDLNALREVAAFDLEGLA